MNTHSHGLRQYVYFIIKKSVSAGSVLSNIHMSKKLDINVNIPTYIFSPSISTYFIYFLHISFTVKFLKIKTNIILYICWNSSVRNSGRDNKYIFSIIQ
jgi:hypothetical protein